MVTRVKEHQEMHTQSVFGEPEEEGPHLEEGEQQRRHLIHTLKESGSGQTRPTKAVAGPVARGPEKWAQT
jgi:hypothetical protein